MTRTLVVVGHPDLAASHINKAWVDALKPHQNEDLKIHILSDVVKSDGTFDIVAEQELLSSYDRIVLQYPLYWYMVPAIMKKWMDTVWAEGWCYGAGGDKMEGKQLDLVTSCGAPAFCFDPNTPGGVALDHYTDWLRGTAGFVRGKAGGVHALFGAEADDIQERLPKEIASYLSFILQK